MDPRCELSYRKGEMGRQVAEGWGRKALVSSEESVPHPLSHGEPLQGVNEAKWQDDADIFTTIRGTHLQRGRRGRRRKARYTGYR